MARRPCSFRKTDVRRAVEAAEATGKPIAGVEVRPDGTVFVRYGEPLAADEKAADDDLTAVIAEIKANGKARNAH